MKLRILFIASFIVLSTLLLLTQAGYVSANHSNPVSSPISYFTYKINGNITYRIFLRGLPSQIVKARYVSLEAKNVKTNETFGGSSDEKGEYSLPVKPGAYLVKVVNSPYKFVPSVRFVNVKQDIYNVNFQGYIKTY